MTFFGPSMTEKIRGRSEGEENIGVFPVTVGGRARVMRVFLIHARAWVRGVGLKLNPSKRRWALTEPERLHCRLCVTEPERSINGC